MFGRPRGSARPTAAEGPPIGLEEPGRLDERRPGYCDSCKVPAGTEKLLTFELRLRGRPAGEWTLCERCWLWRNDRHLDPDPLHVEDAA